MNHGQGKAVNEFLFAMLKMMFDAYLQSMTPRDGVSCARIKGLCRCTAAREGNPPGQNQASNLDRRGPLNLHPT